MLEFGASPTITDSGSWRVGRRLVAIDAVWTGDATSDELAALQGVLD